MGRDECKWQQIDNTGSKSDRLCESNAAKINATPGLHDDSGNLPISRENKADNTSCWSGGLSRFLKARQRGTSLRGLSFLLQR